MVAEADALDAAARRPAPVLDPERHFRAKAPKAPTVAPPTPEVTTDDGQ
jgi:hypothetical protein